MSSYTLSETAAAVTIVTEELALSFSREHGGLVALTRRGGANMAGNGEARPSLDVAVGERGWIGEAVSVRYLRHRAFTRQSAALEVVIELVIGIGPLCITDAYAITGTLVRRAVALQNVGEDDVLLRGVRLCWPWLALGGGSGRLEAPGSSLRPRLAQRSAADRRANATAGQLALVQRDERGLDRSPLAGSGLLALTDPIGDEVLLLWYGGLEHAATPIFDGNMQALTLQHQIELAAVLGEFDSVALDGQRMVLLNEPWRESLAAYHRTRALEERSSFAPPQPWTHHLTLCEIHPDDMGGMAGLCDALPRLRALGVDALCLLPLHLSPVQFVQEAALPSLAPLDEPQRAALRELCEHAHALGLRIILDLPLGGSQAGAPLVRQHPEWHQKSRASQGLWSGTTIPFEWSSAELQTMVEGYAVALLRETGADGIRALPPRSASLPSLGFLSTLERLRHRLDAEFPGAALFASQGGSAFTHLADSVVDELVHQMFFQLALGRLTPTELAAWLDDHLAAQRASAIRSCYVESIHAHLLNPLAIGMRGSRISASLLIGMIACGFRPLIRAGQEAAARVLLPKLLMLAHTHEALRDGELLLDAVGCSRSDMFIVLRRSGRQHLMAIVHVGAVAHTAEFELPVDKLELPEQVTLCNMLSSAPFRELRCARADLAALTLTLEPYGALLIEIAAE